MDKRAEHTLNNIEHDLKHHPHNFNAIYHELNNLRHHDLKHFHHNVEEIDKQLHKDGYLPHLHIVDNGKEMLLTHDSKNPKHHAVVGTSEHAPHESRAEQRAYKHMGYNGWKQSADGGGGAHGGYDAHAIEGKVPQGNKKALIDQALETAGQPVTAANEAAVNKIVQHESGWNPNAINLWDRNARAGHPSQGLMQTIPSTFKEYAIKGFDRNIRDPLSNMAAGINYAVHRYGSLENVPGIRALASHRGYVGY